MYIWPLVWVYISLWEKQKSSNQQVCIDWGSLEISRVNDSDDLIMSSEFIVYTLIELINMDYFPEKKYSDDYGQWVSIYHEQYKLITWK